MSLAHILAPFVKPKMQPTDTGLRALLAACLITGAPISGPVVTAETLRKRDGLRLMAEREILAADRQKAARLHKRVSSIDRKLQAVTLELLRGANGL